MMHCTHWAWGVVLALTFVACDPAEESTEAVPEPTAEQTYDWHVHGGTVVDGTGRAAQAADVLIRADTIAHVGPADPDTIDAASRVDASGLHVAPGFIDAHAHGDPLETPAFENFLAMGVTTILLGQDGSSPEVQTLDRHLDDVAEAEPFVNIAYLVGHNTLRVESGIGYDTPSDAQLQELVARVEAGLEAGAFGLSLGLEYDPGVQAEQPELEAIAEPVAERDAIVMSHMRSEHADDIEASVDELIAQGRATGAHVHASHLKIVLSDDPEQADAVLDQMQEARDDGLQVTGDVYPYTASFTTIGLVFPEWARPPNDYETVRSEREDELRAHLIETIEERNGPNATLFGTGPWSGRTLAEIADEEGRHFADVLMDMGPRGASAAYFVMDERVMQRFLASEHTVVSSDGSPTMRHPRGYGAFSRVLSEYTGAEGPLGLEEAIHQMTGKTASIIGLDDSSRVTPPRGLLREGYAADLVAFDPADVRDRADFEEPHQLAEGMKYVWVNGTLTRKEEALDVDRGAGQMLRDRK